MLNPTISLATSASIRMSSTFPKMRIPKKTSRSPLVPASDIWLRMGRTWFTGSVREEIVWYQEYENERAANNYFSHGLEGFRSIGSPSMWALHIETSRRRPGFEIDTRARRTELEFNGSAEFRGLSKTFFGVRGSRLKVDYAQDATFEGVSLESELNRVSTTIGAFVRNQVTPLTSIAVVATRIEDRFEFSPLRDSNSTGVSTEIVFDPFALIKGSVAVGYRDFQPLVAGVQSYQGATAAINLSYTLLGSTKIGFDATRDVQYSYDVNQPYYVLTGFRGSISQQVYGPVDVVGRGGADTLAYRDRIGADCCRVEPSRSRSHIWRRHWVSSGQGVAPRIQR